MSTTNGGPAPGYSSGEAEALITGLAEASLPNGMHAEWTELTYQKELAGNAGMGKMRLGQELSAEAVRRGFLTVCVSSRLG